MSPELIVQVKREPGYTIVTVAGELDIATVPQLREHLVALLAGHRPLVIDLDRVSFCDATGLGVLVGAANRAGASGASVHLICSRPQTRRLFQLTGLAQRLPLASTMAEAVATLPETSGDRILAPGSSKTMSQPPSPARSGGDQHDGPV
ncbi:MAG TPA: STAS domain-containing protein [Streptosporangiaceae bacterium]|jgi:anti-sigma B factor antagonist|nr:STAS domain-containing protein [Streptosporangiaceae bacterium]